MIMEGLNLVLSLIASVVMISGVSAPDSVSVVMVGDILLHTPVEEAAQDLDGNYNFDFVFSQTKDSITAADLAIVNQEVIIGGKELGVSGYPAFNAPYEIGDALSGAGFDVVCHATNHALDKGKRGILMLISAHEKFRNKFGYSLVLAYLCSYESCIV